MTPIFIIFLSAYSMSIFFRDIICMIMQIMIIRNCAGSFVDVGKNRRMMIGCNLVTLFISFPVLTVVYIISECVEFVYVLTIIVWSINELFGFDLKEIYMRAPVIVIVLQLMTTVFNNQWKCDKSLNVFFSATVSND